MLTSCWKERQWWRAWKWIAWAFHSCYNVWRRPTIMFLCIWSDSRLWCIFLLTPLPKVLLVLSLSSLPVFWGSVEITAWRYHWHQLWLSNCFLYEWKLTKIITEPADNLGKQFIFYSKTNYEDFSILKMLGIFNRPLLLPYLKNGKNNISPGPFLNYLLHEIGSIRTIQHPGTKEQTFRFTFNFRRRDRHF